MFPKIAIYGYGKMGKIIHNLAQDKEITVTNIFENNKKLIPEKSYDFDVAIEFTQPDSVLNNIKLLAGAGKNIVVGTTGWYEKEDEVRKIVEQNNIGLVWASNFSIGVQMFFNIVKNAAKLLNLTDDYDIGLHEIHHTGKKDSPSGTAFSLAKLILNEYSRKKAIVTEFNSNTILQENLYVSSNRIGSVTGTHSILIDSEADTIELIHTAKNRKGFALGALKAAELIHNKKGFYEFGELLKI